MCCAEPIGFRYQNFSSPGVLVYTFPTQPTSSRDEIAFGVMTKQSNAVLFRVFSEIINDYIEFRLVGIGINPNTQEVKYERFLISTRQHSVQILGIGFLQQSDEQTEIPYKNDEYLSLCNVRGGLCSEASSLMEIE